MKKYWVSKKYKDFNLKRSKNRAQRAIIHDKKQKEKRKSRQGIKKAVLKKKNTTAPHVTKTAPPNFSFIDNTTPVLEYLEDLKYCFNRKQNVLIDLRNITNITNDAIVLLMSVIWNPAITKGVIVKGNYPKDDKLRKILIESGVFKQEIKDDSQHVNYILTRKNKKAEGKDAAELIRRATKVIFGSDGRCPGIYKALMECMANTCYHAKPQKTGYETWWLTVYHNRDANHVSFAFIDTGVGIFKSNKMRDFGAQFASLFGLSDNREILGEILSGRKRSSTKIPYRGKGLPAIYKGLERNYYSNLKIISNDVKADLVTNEFIKLDAEFKGTFLYWELNSSNRWTQ